MPRRAGDQRGDQQIQRAVADQPQAEGDQRRQVPFLAENGATEARKLQFVQRMAGQCPDGGARRLGGGQRLSGAGEVVGGCRQPGEIGLKSARHAAAVLERIRSTRSPTFFRLAVCAAENLISKAFCTVKMRRT